MLDAGAVHAELSWRAVPWRAGTAEDSEGSGTCSRVSRMG